MFPYHILAKIERTGNMSYTERKVYELLSSLETVIDELDSIIERREKEMEECTNAKISKNN